MLLLVGIRGAVSKFIMLGFWEDLISVDRVFTYVVYQPLGELGSAMYAIH
jgi:hypothetical protein